MASLMLAEALKRAVARDHPQPLAGDSRSSTSKHRTGCRASALCPLCHFHLKICVDSAVIQLGRVLSFPLAMAHPRDTKWSGRGYGVDGELL
jgi:hypothetical protein